MAKYGWVNYGHARCYTITIEFTHPGKKAKEWTKGQTWGIRIYPKMRFSPDDKWTLFTIQLFIGLPQHPQKSLGPNKVLVPANPKPISTPKPRDTKAPISTTETPLQTCPLVQVPWDSYQPLSQY